jgi:hypothetical protein
MEMILKEHGRGFVLKHEHRYGCHYAYGYKWTLDVANLPRLLKARILEASCIDKLELEEQVVQTNCSQMRRWTWGMVEDLKGRIAGARARAG